uniref:Uncharacterized protein n=1 Tax=Anguilla anguilla TaxID=7936 RepID=A0A0E9QZI9_ANGAN
MEFSCKAMSRYCRPVVLHCFLCYINLLL